MKKTFCILTAILLLALISISVPAEEKDAKQADPFVIDNPEYGFHFVIPEKYRNLKGILDIRANDLEDGVFQFTISYYAVSEENFDAYNDYSEKFYEALMSGEEPPASPDPSWMTDAVRPLRTASPFREDGSVFPGEHHRCIHGAFSRGRRFACPGPEGGGDGQGSFLILPGASV